MLRNRSASPVWSWVVSMWPWPWTFWPQSLISLSVSPKCSKVVNLVKFLQAVYKSSCTVDKLLVHDYGRTYVQPANRMPPRNCSNVFGGITCTIRAWPNALSVPLKIARVPYSFTHEFWYSLWETSIPAVLGCLLPPPLPGRPQCANCQEGTGGRVANGHEGVGRRERLPTHWGRA